MKGLVLFSLVPMIASEILPTDYNICSGDNISFQIDNSGIDGTVKGFKSSKEIKEFLDFEE